jgi:clan AA aspartic protease
MMQRMSLFRINLEVADPRDITRVSGKINALVDTGSELTWVPAPILEAIGIVRLKKKSFRTASNQTLLRDVGYGVIRAEGFETIDEVVFGESTDMTLLGVRTLEGFSAMVDALGRKLVATTTIVAGCSQGK